MSDAADLPAEPVAPGLRVLSLCTQFAGLGGVESVLRDHHGHDRAHGIDSRFAVFWEPVQAGWPDARFLGFDDGLRIREARGRVAGAMRDFDPQAVVYHTVWGWPYFDDLLGNAPRILYLHSDTPGLQGQLATRAWWADGFACVNDRLVERVLQARPGLQPERIHRVDYPVVPPANLSSLSRPFARPLVLGFCGRLEVEQKRVDRLPELIARLDAAGLPYRFEFLGDGPKRAWLETQLPDRMRFVFHGRKSGDEYWRILSGWDAILFISDYEGTPIALLEAMTAGVVPLHPKIGCGGDHYAARVRPDLAYPPGDMAALAGLVVGMAKTGPEAAAVSRTASAQVVAGHSAERYRDSMAHFVRRIAGLPRLERRPLPRRPFPMDWLSFRTARRLMELRRRSAS